MNKEQYDFGDADQFAYDRYLDELEQERWDLEQDEARRFRAERGGDMVGAATARRFHPAGVDRLRRRRRVSAVVGVCVVLVSAVLLHQVFRQYLLTVVVLGVGLVASLDQWGQA